MSMMLLIPTNGAKEISVHRFSSDDWRGMAAAIGAQYIERVRVAENIAMAVDEEGLMDARKKFNPRASLLYGTPRHGSPIMGDALFGIEGMATEGVEWIDADEHELHFHFNALSKAARRHYIRGSY